MASITRPASAGRRRRLRPGQWLLAAAILAVYGGFIVMILLSVRGGRPPVELPPLEVQLVGLVPPPAPPPKAERIKPKPPSQPSQAPARHVTAAPAPGPVTPAAPGQDSAAQPAAPVLPVLPGVDIRRALRTSSGCSDADMLELTGPERESCQRRREAIRQDAPTYDVVPLDPVKAAAFAKVARQHEEMRRYMEGPMPPEPCRTLGCPGAGPNDVSPR